MTSQIKFTEKATKNIISLYSVDSMSVRSLIKTTKNYILLNLYKCAKNQTSFH